MTDTCAHCHKLAKTDQITGLCQPCADTNCSRCKRCAASYDLYTFNQKLVCANCLTTDECAVIEADMESLTDSAYFDRYGFTKLGGE